MTGLIFISQIGCQNTGGLAIALSLLRPRLLVGVARFVRKSEQIDEIVHRFYVLVWRRIGGEPAAVPNSFEVAHGPALARTTSILF